MSARRVRSPEAVQRPVRVYRFSAVGANQLPVADRRYSKMNFMVSYSVEWRLDQALERA
jgi:hypothetical protein